jgi:hypothetical protein
MLLDQFWPKSSFSFLRSMVAFSKARLEGRALEHALAGDRGSSVRMYDERAKRWVQVRTLVAKAAMLYMRCRAKVLVAQLLERGFACKSADVPATLHKQDAGKYGKSISVDLRLHCKAKAGGALVEVKWTRGRKADAVRRVRGCIPKLKAASLRGRWNGSDRRISAALVGFLVVCPKTWSLELQGAQGRWKHTCSAEDDPLPQRAARMKQSGKSNWKTWRGDAPPGSPEWPNGKPGKSRGGRKSPKA